MKKKIHLIGTKKNLEQVVAEDFYEFDEIRGMGDEQCQGLGETIVDMLTTGCVTISVQVS